MLPTSVGTHWIRRSNEVSNILIETDNGNKFNTCERALSLIKSKPIGRDLLNQIESFKNYGKTVKIKVNGMERNTAFAILSRKQAKQWNVKDNESDILNKKVAYQLSTKQVYPIDGPWNGGADAIISWNNHLTGVLANGELSAKQKTTGNHINLAHELIHALHILEGSVLVDSYEKQEQNGVSTLDEERRTIGLDEFSLSKYTENNIRREQGFVIREKLSNYIEE